jgi:hypothetical protein
VVQLHACSSGGGGGGGGSGGSFLAAAPGSYCVLLLPSEDVPTGHVEVSPPLQQALAAPAHTYLRLTQLGTPLQLQSLPQISLWPCLVAGDAGSGGDAAGSQAGESASASAPPPPQQQQQQQQHQQQAQQAGPDGTGHPVGGLAGAAGGGGSLAVAAGDAASSVLRLIAAAGSLLLQRQQQLPPAAGLTGSSQAAAAQQLEQQHHPAGSAAAALQAHPMAMAVAIGAWVELQQEACSSAVAALSGRMEADGSCETRPQASAVAGLPMSGPLVVHLADSAPGSPDAPSARADHLLLLMPGSKVLRAHNPATDGPPSLLSIAAAAAGVAAAAAMAVRAPGAASSGGGSGSAQPGSQTQATLVRAAVALPAARPPASRQHSQYLIPQPAASSSGMAGCAAWLRPQLLEAVKR